MYVTFFFACMTDICSTSSVTKALKYGNKVFIIWWTTLYLQCIAAALAPQATRVVWGASSRSPCSEQSSLDIWSSPTFLDPPWFISAQRRNKRGSSMSKRKMLLLLLPKTKLLWIWMERKLYTTVFREDLELTRFSTSIFSIRHMWPNVSFLTRKQPCTACSSRRINYVWKEEASNFQCTNTLFALSFVFVLLLLFVLRGLSTLLHFLAFVIPGENQCFLFPHILRFFFLTCPISYSLFFY